jgi:hypothetical protein
LAACPCGGELCAWAFHSRREDQRIALRITETSAITRPVIQPATFCEERDCAERDTDPDNAASGDHANEYGLQRGRWRRSGSIDVYQRVLTAILCSLAVACHAGGVLSVLPF